MNQPILDMRAIVAHEYAADEASQSFLDKLLANLRHLPDTSDADLADELRERAAAYEESQPSFAADLRAALA